MRYVFKAIDISLSVILLALCTNAFCTHFYLDIKRQLHARKLPTAKDTPSLIPSDEIDPIKISAGKSYAGTGAGHY